MANNLTLTNATFGSTGQKFGTGDLNGGYGVGATTLTALPFTIECWVSGTVTPSGVVVALGQNSVGYMGSNNSGFAQFQYGQSGPTLSGTTNLFDGVQHHLRGVVTSSAYYLFVDGALSATAPLAVTGVFTKLGVGNHADAASYQWPGTVDEAGVWAYAVSTTAFTPPTSAYSGSEGMVCLWHLDGNGTDSAGTSASGYSLAGPSSGSSNAASAAFTVTLSTASSSTVVITPSDGGAGGTFSPATLSFASNATAAQTFTYSPAAVGTVTISTNNNAGLTNPAGLSYAALAGAFAPNNTAIVYSPYGWLVTGTSAKTINAGTYFSTTFSGSSCYLTFDISANSTPLPEAWYSIDGQPKVQFTLAATVSLTMPSTTTAWPHHQLRVWIKSTSEFVTRWSPQNAAVTLTGVGLASGSTLIAPATASAKNVLFFGDSITEGYHAVGSTSNDCDGSDTMLSWAYLQKDLLGVEVGVIGFGGTGLLGNGQGGVPPVAQSFPLLWSGQSRTFTPVPDLIVINEGENDRAADPATFQPAFQSFLTALLAAVPTCPVAVMRPFSGAQATAIQAAITAIGSARLTYVDTTGFFNTTDSVDGQHPLGVANLGQIAPQVAAKLRPLLVSAGTSTVANHSYTYA